MAGAEQDIGLLLVHGMGEQKRLDHLMTSAREYASFIAAAPGLRKLSIVTAPPEEAKVTIDAVFDRDGVGERVRLHLHEVWWADLGISGGVVEQVKFWLWGLGQWAAEVLRAGDPSRNTAQLMAMPRFDRTRPAGSPPGLLRELPSRLLLSGAALIAILTFFTWSAAKGLIRLLSGRLPDPSLIFLFLGDVKIYERPAGPGKGTLLDPDMPVRATIRRRVVSAVAAMATRPYDEWYLFAHSLGTIPAFNALQETELALPNYLTEAEWRALPSDFKSTAPFKPEGSTPSTGAMMPRRPPWLLETDGIDRRRLFEGLAGFVTYGSPLDKFAALWPRVVPLNRQAAVFRPDCEWVNLHDPTDPVSARLDAFAPPEERADRDVTDRATLKPLNFATRASLVFGLSHIRYFRPRRRTPRSMPAALTEALVSGGRESLRAAAGRARIPAAEAWVRAGAALLQLLLLALALTTAAAALLLMLGKALPDAAVVRIKDALATASPGLLADLVGGGLDALRAAILIVLALALMAILAAGTLRAIADLFRPRTPDRQASAGSKRA